MNIESDPNGMWCIYYAKIDDRKTWNVMKLQRKDGVIVAAKTYDEAFKYSDTNHAFDFMKSLYDTPDQKYFAEVKRLYRRGENEFYV